MLVFRSICFYAKSRQLTLILGIVAVKEFLVFFMLIFLIITYFPFFLGVGRCCGAYYGDGEVARLEYYSVKHMTYWSSSEYGNGNDADNDWS